MFENLFEKKIPVVKPKTGQMFESLFEPLIESRQTRVERLKIEAEESKKIAEEMAKPTAIAKETIKGTWDILKGIGKAIEGIAKQTPHYISEAAKHPHQTAIGVMETGVLKPTIGITKLLLPKKYEEKIIPTMEEGLEEVQEMMPSKEARTVGNITGWLLPYTAGAKIAMKGMEATNIAIKLGKHAPGVANAFGFLGTGQILFDSKTESSRARRAVEDLAILAGFRVGGYVLKGASQMAGKAVERTVMPIIARMKSGKKVPLAEVEKAVYKARAITEGMTKKKPEQIIEKEIIPRAEKVKVSSQKELAVLKEINKEIPGIKGIENRIQEIQKITKVAPKIVKPTKLPVEQVGKPSKVALSIEVKAIEKDLTKGFKDLAEYTPTTIKQQAEKMSTLMKDIEKAKRVAMGKEQLPEGLNGATVITTMEKYALKTKNGELMAELARSPLVSETSMAGQTLRLTAEREPESAVRKMKEIIKAREEAVKRKLKWKKPEQIKSGIKKSLEDKIKKTKPNKYSWEKLITEITC